MSTLDNFAVIPFGEHIGDNASDLNLPSVPFVGNQSTLKHFEIAGQVIGHCYLLVQSYEVGVDTHAIAINGNNLTGLSIPHHDGWETWLVVLQDLLLHKGRNSIQVLRDTATTDDFVIGNIVIHWHERAS